MMGHIKIFLAALIFITGSLAQGVSDNSEDHSVDEFSGNNDQLEETKSDFMNNGVTDKKSRMELEQVQEDEMAEAAVIRLQNEAALAVISGTRRRGSHRNATTIKPANRRGCVTEGAIFAEGSAMVSPDECSYCFCIRGKQRCVAPKCLLPVEGCRPRYRSFSCCPSFYDCHDASTTTTTTTRTPRDCDVDGVRYPEGSLVEGAGGECENCYCLGGEVTCSRTTCAPPLDGCKPVMKEGHCCPVKYDCDDGNHRVSIDQIFKDSPVKIATADQRQEFERMKPEWLTNMARQSPGGEQIITDLANQQSPSETPSEQASETPPEQASETEEREDPPPDEGVSRRTPSLGGNKLRRRFRPSATTETEASPPEEKEEITDEEKAPSERRQPGRNNQRRRLTSLISRPSRKDIAERRKQSRYPQRRPGAQRQRPPSQSLSFRFRQRIKLDKEKEKSEESQDDTSKTSTTSSTSPSPSTSLTTTLLSSESTTKSMPTSSTTTQTTTLLPSESTTTSTPTSTASQTTTEAEDYLDTITELETTAQDYVDSVTSTYEDTTSIYGPVPGILDTFDEYETSEVTIDDTGANLLESTQRPSIESTQRPSIESTQRPSTESTQRPSIESTQRPSIESTQRPSIQEFIPQTTDLSTDPPSFYTTTENPMSTHTPPPSSTTTNTTTTSPTTTTTATSPTTTTILTTTESEDESLPEVTGIGHVGEVFLVNDHSKLTMPLPLQDPPAFKVDEAISVGTGVNVKGNINDAVAFGPILIYDNRVRTDRQNKDLNATDVEGTADGENTIATDIPEETTMLSVAETNIPDDGITLGELLAEYDIGTEEMTTLFPALPAVQETTVKSLSELLSRATAASTVTTTKSVAETPSLAPDATDNIPGDEPDYTDIETSFPSYDITVGTSVLATSQARPPSSGVGEVIPVELKPEHKSPEIESGPVLEENGPSFLGTILNFLTRTERPRPDRLPPPPPPPRPPFRPRPRPDGRPDRRPDFIPPRFRPPPLMAIEKDSTEEPETNIATSPPAPLVIPTARPPPLVIPTARPPLLVIPTSQPDNAPNKPVTGFIRPKPIVNSPVDAFNRPDVIPSRPNIPNRPDFTPNRPAPVVPEPIIPIDSEGLPSEPVIEGGFQGMKDKGEGIEPAFDFDYDGDDKPTLPPSLPNLKIIPFVAADALVNQEIGGIAGDEFKTPLVLAEKGEDKQELTPATTAATTTTTTRRSFLRLPVGERRPPILPPRRTVNRPGDGPITRRPFLPFRRPGERTTRSPPLPFKTSTTTPRAPEDNKENPPADTSQPDPILRPGVAFANRERPATRPPFIPPRRPTPTTAETTTTSATTTTTTTPRPQPTTTTQRPIISDDIANLLLQDVFQFPPGQNTPPVRFIPDRTTSKPIIPVKISTALPEIPDAVRDQLPLATDPVLASGLLKLSGCNIYGRMYGVGNKIKELSGGCKECRCTPVGVQCLPIC